MDTILKALSPNCDDRYATAADLSAAIEGYLEARGERVSMRDVGRFVAAHFEALHFRSFFDVAREENHRDRNIRALQLFEQREPGLVGERDVEEK